MDALCRIYQPAVMAYLRSRLNNPQDAEDLAQDFFAKITDGTLFRSAEPNKGRFRALLLTALKNFLYDAFAKAKAQKRGGDASFVSIDQAGDAALVGSSTEKDISADLVFDLAWARTVSVQALDRIRERFEARGESSTYHLICPFLMRPAEGAEFEAVCRQLKASNEAAQARIRRFRTLFRKYVREELARTVESPHEIEMELRYLRQVLAAAP